MKLKELFKNQNIDNMELKELLESLNYEDFNKLLKNTENSKDIDFYVNLQDFLIQEKQKELIEKDVFWWRIKVSICLQVSMEWEKLRCLTQWMEM